MDCYCYLFHVATGFVFCNRLNVFERLERFELIQVVDPYESVTLEYGPVTPATANVLLFRGLGTS